MVYDRVLGYFEDTGKVFIVLHQPRDLYKEMSLAKYINNSRVGVTIPLI